MYKYLKQHEAFIRHILASEGSEYDWNGLSSFHKTQIAFMQHERLIHLMVTLAFGVFLLIALGLTVMSSEPIFGVFVFLFLLLLFPYIIHYFRLENGVQRWYQLANEIEGRCGRVSACYEVKKKKT